MGFWIHFESRTDNVDQMWRIAGGGGSRCGVFCVSREILIEEEASGAEGV